MTLQNKVSGLAVTNSESIWVTAKWIMDSSEHKYVALQDVELFSWKKKKNLHEAPTRKNLSSGFLADRVKDFEVQGPASKNL